VANLTRRGNTFGGCTGYLVCRKNYPEAQGQTRLQPNERKEPMNSPGTSRPMNADDHELLDAKTQDALSAPGFAADFDPDEAAQMGAFRETAISEQDAIESAPDLIDAAP
jgi:hypothetical protein